MQSKFNEEPRDQNTKWDQLLSKYSIVWVWSIIVGLNSSLFFSFFNSRGGNFGMLSILMVVFNAMAIGVSILSWMMLFKILQRTILPMLFNLENSDERKEKQMRIAHETSYYVSRAFNYMIYAISLKFMVFLIDGIFSALNKY